MRLSHPGSTGRAMHPVAGWHTLHNRSRLHRHWLASARAARGGKTEELARKALEQNLAIFTLPSLHNANLVEIGTLILPTCI